MEKVAPRLHEDTKAVKDKQRGKFDPSTQTGRDACSMGGNVVRTTGRAMVSWMNKG